MAALFNNSTEYWIASDYIAWYDEAGMENAPYGPVLTGIRTTFVVLTCLVTITGNAFSLAVMKSVKSPRFPPSTKVFLCNVIVFDLAYGLCSVIFIAPAAMNTWPYGDFICNASNFMDAWICACCVTAAIFVTIDRVLAVIYPLRHAVMIPKRRAVTIIIITAIVSFGTIMVVFVDLEVSYNNNAIMCLVKWSTGTTRYLLRLITLGFYSCFIPSAILVGCYAKLYLVARRQASRHARQRCRGKKTARRVRKIRSVPKTDRNFRALKMCSLITASFCLAWTPYVAVSFRNYIVMKEAPPLVDFVMNWLCVSNSWWDVIIYFFMAEEFRKTARKLVNRGRQRLNYVTAVQWTQQEQ